MKRSRACSLWVALSPLLLSGSPVASAEPPTARGTPVPTRPPATAVFPPLPLKGPLTLDSGKKPSVVPPKVDYNGLRQDLQDLSSALNSYAPRLSLMKNAVTQCRNHKYTVEEQLKAGCKGTDTLDQCKEKLFLYCMNTSYAAGLQSYKEATQKFLEEIPKLIELLKKAQARVKYEANYYDFD